jgi:predicted ester cyclase
VTQIETTGTEQVARSYFQALTDRDAQKMASHWDPQGIEDIGPFGIFRGPDEVRSFFDELFAAIPDSETIVDRVVTQGDTAAVQWRLRGTFSGGPFQGIDPVGKHVEMRGCDVLEIEGGKIARNTAFTDGLAFARQVGLVPPQGSGAEKAMFGAFNGLTRVKKAIGGSSSR